MQYEHFNCNFRTWVVLSPAIDIFKCHLNDGSMVSYLCWNDREVLDKSRFPLKFVGQS